MDTLKRPPIEERNVVSLDSIGIIPQKKEEVHPETKEDSPFMKLKKRFGVKERRAAEQLKFKGDIAFSNVDEVVDYLKKRQNIFTYALEASLREKEATSATMVESFKGNIGWEKKQDGQFVRAYRDEHDAMFTADNLCLLACFILIAFLREATKDQEDTDIDMLRVDARKKTTDSSIAEVKTFGHNIVYVKIGDREVCIDPTYRQVDSENLEPFLFITDMNELTDRYVPDKEGNIFKKLEVGEPNIRGNEYLLQMLHVSH